MADLIAINPDRPPVKKDSGIEFYFSDGEECVSGFATSEAVELSISDAAEYQDEDLLTKAVLRYEIFVEIANLKRIAGEKFPLFFDVEDVERII
jgi:hypothetical protein